MFHFFIQLLRAMFGINVVSQPDLAQTPVYPGCLGDTLISLPVSMATEYVDDGGDGLYYDCFELPQREYLQSIEKIVQKEEESESSLKRLSLTCRSYVLSLFSFCFLNKSMFYVTNVAGESGVSSRKSEEEQVP